MSYESDREDSAVYYDCEPEPRKRKVQPIRDGLGRDPLEVLLEDADRLSKKLRATRDSAAIQRSTERMRGAKV